MTNKKLKIWNIINIILFISWIVLAFLYIYNL